MPRKKPKGLPHVRYQVTRGKTYAYFNTGKKDARGRTIYVRLPEPASGSFFQSYGALKAAREQRAKPQYTFVRMADDYRDSEDYANKSEGTQKAYRSILKPALDLLGDIPVNAITRTMIQAILDKRPEWGAGKRNLFVAVIGAVYAWGRKRGKTDLQPTRGIEVAETGEHLPWPDDVLKAGLAAEGRLGLAVALMLYTGQRIGDVCKMRWSDITDGAIAVTQQKTGKKLVVRVHSGLQAALDRYGKRGITLLTGENGEPIGTQVIRDEIKALVKAHGHPTLRPHGLRKNAVIALLRHRCSVPEVAAVTGQTYALVEYYARQIDQERMADAAILRWEQSGPMQTVFANPPQVTGK